MAPKPPSPPAPESFGRRLRRERERQKISIASIARSTKINAWLFEALERDDASRWPSGIFRRSFIRAYAKAIGLDPEATAREFLDRFPDPNDPDTAGAAAPVAALPARTSLRLTVAEAGASFAGGPVLHSAGRRLGAVACDITALSIVGLAIYAVIGAWWMPLCLAIAVYYAGSILVLGNTPGVALLAAEHRGGESTRGDSPKPWRARSSVVTLFSAVRPDLPLSNRQSS